MSTKTFKPFPHQAKFADLWGAKRRVLNFDGCGTGKTLACIHAVKTFWPKARVLVLAPLSILDRAWGSDLEFGAPHMMYAVANGTKMQRIRQINDISNQWIITTHDAVKLIADNNFQDLFDVLIVDEADAFRNRDSQRSKALQKVAHSIPVATFMTGTPTPNSVTDIWHLAFLTDKGERLGRNFFGFRQQVCNPEIVFGAPAGAMRWVDKPTANDHVTMCLSDISTRVALDDVQDLPDTIYRTMKVTLPKNIRSAYEFMKRESIMLLDSGQLVNAIHAGARMQKLLQTVSGVIYGEGGETHQVHKERTELVLDLAEETDHALVAFNWTHQRDQLVAEAKKRGLTHAVIDGSVSATERGKIVSLFQAGRIRVLFAHPQSAGHGLTLTRANRIIWASPTYRADLHEQFNHRIIRTGQQRKTEIIYVAAEETVEEGVYERLQEKRGRMTDLLDTFKELFKAA